MKPVLTFDKTNMVVLTYIFSINIVAHLVNKKARHYTRLFCIIYNLLYQQKSAI